MHLNFRLIFIRKNIFTFLAVVAYFWFSISAFIANQNTNELEQLFEYENQTALSPPKFWNALFQPSNIYQYYTNVEQIQQARINLTEKNCRKLELTADYNFKRPAARFYVDERRQLLYCDIPTAADTINFKRLMLVLSGTVDSENFSSVSRKTVHSKNPVKRIEPQNAEDLVRHGVSEYKKVIFVRHPFERLVSAYYSKLARGNKLENIPSPITKDTTEYPLLVGRKIIQKYRPNATKLSLEKGHDVTIPEFVSYVIDEWAENDKKPVDVHWRSQVDLCHPCSIKYDIIGKYETLKQDVDYILRKLEGNELNQFFKSNEPYSTSSLVEHFLNQLSSRQLNDLYRIYQKDLSVFGYNDAKNTK